MTRACAAPKPESKDVPATPSHTQRSDPPPHGPADEVTQPGPAVDGSGDQYRGDGWPNPPRQGRRPADADAHHVSAEDQRRPPRPQDRIGEKEECQHRVPARDASYCSRPGRCVVEPSHLLLCGHHDLLTGGVSFLHMRLASSPKGSKVISLMLTG